MELLVFPCPPIETNAFVVAEPESGEAVLFDAPQEVFDRIGPQLEEKGWKLVALLMTHGHWDHLLDAWQANEKELPVYAHKGDEPLYTNPRIMSAFSLPGVEMKPLRVDHWLEDGATVEMLGTKITALHVPGHSPGSIAFHFPEYDFVIGGDALFKGSIGRTDVPAADADTLLRSIRTKLYALPDKTRVFPGHGPHTTIADEKASNPFVRA